MGNGTLPKGFVPDQAPDQSLPKGFKPDQPLKKKAGSDVGLKFAAVGGQATSSKAPFVSEALSEKKLPKQPIDTGTTGIQKNPNGTVSLKEDRNPLWFEEGYVAPVAAKEQPVNIGEGFEPGVIPGTYQKKRKNIFEGIEKSTDPVAQVREAFNTDIQNAHTPSHKRQIEKSYQQVVHDLLPDGYESKQLLINNGKDIESKPFWSKENTTGNNLTLDALKSKAQQYDNATQPLREVNTADVPTFEEYIAKVGADPKGEYAKSENAKEDYRGYVSHAELAPTETALIKLYAQKNPHFLGQVEAAGLDINDPNLVEKFKEIDSAVSGALISQALQDEDLAAYATKENPRLIPIIQQVSKDLRSRHPEYGANQVANEVSQQFYKVGSHNAFANFATSGRKQDIDEVAQELYKNDPQSLKIWQDQVKPHMEKYIDDPSFVQGVGESIKGFLGGWRETLSDPSISQSVKDQWIKDATHVSANPKGFMKFATEGGHAFGFISTLAAGGELLGLVKGARAANAINIAGSMWGDSWDLAVAKYPNNPVKATTSALINTGFMTALVYSDLLPINKAKDLIKGVEPEVGKIVNGLTDGSITREGARLKAQNLLTNAINTLGTGLTENAKISLQMSAGTLLNNTFDKIVGLDEETQKQYNQSPAETFVSMFMSNAGFAGLIGYGQTRARNKMLETTMYRAATEPKQLLRALDEAVLKNPELPVDEIKANIKFATDLTQLLRERGVSEKNIPRYLSEAVQSKVKSERLKASPESGVKRANELEIKRHDEIMDAILKGEDAEKVVTEDEKKAASDSNKLYEKGKSAVQKLLDEVDAEGKPVFKGEGRDAAKKDPEAFLRQVADQVFGYERVNDKRIASETAPPDEKVLVDKYTADVVNAAKEMFPDKGDEASVADVKAAMKPKPADQLFPEGNEVPTEQSTVIPTELKNVGVGGDVDAQYNERKKSIEDKLNQQLEDNKDYLDDIADKGGTKTVRQKIYQEHTNDMVELEKWKMKEDLKKEDTPDGRIKKNSEFSSNQLTDAIPNSEVHYENKEDYGVTTITLRDKNTKKHIASIDIGTGDTIDGYAGVRIQVNGEHQGKGLSKHLYNLALTEAKKQGLKGLYTIDEMLKTPDKTIATRDNFVTRKNTDEKLKTQARKKYTNVADPNITFIENVSDKFIKKGATKLSEQSLSKQESGDKASNGGGDVEATAKKIVGESAFDKLKKEGYTIEKGKFDSDAYASFFGLHTGVQADEFANAGLRLVKPSEKIKVYRGKGKNVSEGENEGVTWVAEDKKVAENYSNDGNVEEIEVTKPKNPFPNPTDTIHVKGSDVGNKLKGILNRLFREGKVTKEQAIEASKAIDEFVLAAGEESELYSTKTNKKGVSSKYVKALQALGFDGIVQKESYNSGSPFTATKTGNETNTYGIFKAVEQSIKEQPKAPTEQKVEGVEPIAPESGVKVVMPEENTPPNVIPLKTAEPPVAEPPANEPPTGAPGVNVPKEINLTPEGITHAANEVRRKERELPEYERTPESFEQWNNEAEQKLKDGYDVDDLISRIEKGHDPTPVENAIRKIYVATLDAEILKNPTDELLAKQKRFIQAGDLANSRAGRNLVSLKGVGSAFETISDFYVAKMESSGVDRLTENQKEEVKKQFEEIKNRAENAEKKVTEMEAKLAEMEAQKELNRQRGDTKKTKTHEERVKDRKAAVEAAREALKKIRTGESGLTSVSIPGVKELIAIAPHVKKVVESYLGEGIDNLKEIVGKVYDEFKDLGLTEKNVHDIIAGNYSERKYTRGEIAKQMQDLKTEAELLNKLDSILKGEEPKSEKKKIERNKKIKELSDRIKGILSFQKEIKNLGEPVDVVDPSLKSIENAIKRNKERTAEINNKIKNKDFTDKPKKVTIYQNAELKKKYPQEYKEMIDALVAKEDAQHNFDLALLRDRERKMTKLEQGGKFVKMFVATTKALKAGIDFSGTFVQSFQSLFANPKVWAKAQGEAFRQLKSESAYRRYLTELHANEDVWKLMEESGLAVTDPASLRQENREEAFSNSALDNTFKIKGKSYNLGRYTTKPFERHYTALGNFIRVNLFLRESEKLMNEGKTFENAPEEYKAAAARANNLTGRGKLHKNVESASELVTLGIWSPRLMASRLNALGFSDLASPLTGKGYYKGLTPRQRRLAFYDVTKMIGSGIALMAAYGFMGGTAVFNPESPMFGTIKIGNYSVNVFDGFSKYVKSIVQGFTGHKRKNGERVEQNRWQTLDKFFRGSLTPAAATIRDVLSKKDYSGKPITWEGELKNISEPMAVEGMANSLRRDGMIGLLPGFANVFGLNVSDERDFDLSEKTTTLTDPETFIKRQATPEEYKKIKDLTESKESELLKSYENGDETIYVDVNGDAHITPADNIRLSMTWNETPYDKLNDKQKKKVKTEIKKKAFRESKKELYNDIEIDEVPQEKED